MKPKGSENDINIELSKNDIHRIITDAGGKQNIVLSKVKNLVETKTGAKLSDEEAKNLLSKFGAQTDVKGKVSLKLFKDHKLANPFKRDTQVTQDVGNTEERSALYYIRHPFKRQRALGLMKANGRQANLLSNMSEQEYRTLINESRRLGSESRALAEAAM